MPEGGLCPPEDFREMGSPAKRKLCGAAEQVAAKAAIAKLGG